MKSVGLKTITLMWLISLAQGRMIDSPNDLKAEESSDDELKKLINRQIRDKNIDFKVPDSIDQSKNREIKSSRLSESEWSTYSVREANGPGTFAFGYDNALDSAGNEHYRSEERFENGTVIGEYGYTDYAINRIIQVSYIADHRGYRASTKILPLDDLLSRNSISNN